MLVFYYTISPEFNLSTGILARKDFCGVPLTLRHPHETTENDRDVFSDATTHDTDKTSVPDTGAFPGFAVIALSLPPSLLSPLLGYEDDNKLCVLAIDTIDAMRPHTFENIVNVKPWLAGYSLLSPACFVRCFRLMDETHEVTLSPHVHITDSEGASHQAVESDQPSRALSDETSTLSKMSSFKKGVSFKRMWSSAESVPQKPMRAQSNIHIMPVEEISTFLSGMRDVRLKAKSFSVAPLYHYTSMAVAPMIMNGGLRMSTQGQGDGGVYFSTKGPCTTTHLQCFISCYMLISLVC